MRPSNTQPSFIFILYLLLAAIMFFIAPAFGQNNDLDMARQLSYDGYYHEADSMFNSIITKEPWNIEAQLGSAYNHSWHQNLPQAELEFEKILRAEPTNKSALVGLGYTLAWKGDYANAKYPFTNALQTYPHDPEIEKGLAYVYLWQGSSDVAIDMFEDLQEKDPSNPEYCNALAYAHLQRYETIEARRLVNHAINIDPENVAAQQIKSSLAYATPFLEADIWGGYTQIGNMSRAGLRAIQLSTQLSRSFRALVSYDNNMSLDNFYYVDQHLQAETYLAGGIVNWDKQYTTRLQLGYRDLSSTDSQMLVLGEQAVNLKDRKVIKAGGMYAIGHQMTDEWMLYAGINIPVKRHFRVEPIYYISHRGLATSMEHRIGVNSQWTGKSGLEIGAGGHYGKVNAGSETGTAATRGIYIAALIPVHRMVWLQVNLRQEMGIAGVYRMAGFGVKLRFEQ